MKDYKKGDKPFLKFASFFTINLSINHARNEPGKNRPQFLLTED